MRAILVGICFLASCGGGGGDAQATQIAQTTQPVQTSDVSHLEDDIAEIRQQLAQPTVATVNTEDGTAIGWVSNLQVSAAYWVTYSPRPMRLRLDRYPGDFEWAAPVFFEGANCTGQAYMSDNSGAFIEIPGGRTDYYLPTHGTEPQTIYIASRLDGQGPTPCWDWNREVPTLLPAEIVLPDPGPLHIQFP